MQRELEQQSIVFSEQLWRRTTELNRRLVNRVAEFLTPAQLAALGALQRERSPASQQSIEQARLRAGLEPAISEQSEVPAIESGSTRMPIVGAIKLDLQVQVNRSEAVHLRHAGANGESITFEAGDGLVIEATPTTLR